MTVPVRYYCPRCETVATLERDAYLADKSVTPFPLEGWEYATPDDDFEAADGVRLVCGERADGPGCGEPFYLNFVRFEGGEEVEPVPGSEFVEIGDPTRPRGPRYPETGPAP